MKRVFLLFCSMLFLVACTHENPPEVQDAAILSDIAMVRVFDNTMSQRDLIRNAAEQFDLKQAVTRSEKGEREIREIVPINGDNGEPAMYVVNYADNKGWVIVSASTDYAPILAHSDEGNFDVSNIEGNAIEVWVDETKAAIESMKTAPEEEKEKYHTQWMYYASKSVPLTDAVPMTRDDASEALAYQNQCALQWEADGYDVYLLIGFADSQPSYVSNSLMDQIYNDAYTYGTDQYDGVLYNSFVLTSKDITDYHSPLTQTQWRQNGIYNDSIPEGNDYTVGCGPLAVSQIMRYHEHPNTFNWNSMPNKATINTNNGTLCSFLAQIHANCIITYQYNPTYNIIDCGTTTATILSTLHQYGYGNALLVSHNSNINIVLSDIASGKPVLMSGYATSSGGGHMWYCDGYYIQNYAHEVILKTMQTKSSFYTVNYGNQGSGGTSTHFHMVWGSYDEDSSYSSYCLDSGTSFNYNRSDIIHIYPTNN